MRNEIESALKLLATPSDEQDLILDNKSLKSADGKEFPIISEIPWIYESPAAKIWEWKGSINQYRQTLEAEKNYLNTVDQSTMTDLAKKRINTRVQSNAEQLKSIEKILGPLIKENPPSLSVEEALKHQTLLTQSISSYYDNIHRDWGWDQEAQEDENQLSLEQIKPHLDSKPENMLILGSGASRLAYDIHQLIEPKLMILADINPLLLYSAKKIIQGGSIQLFETPIAPKNLESFSIKRRLKCDSPINKGIFYLFCDALNAPFKKEAFDVIVTPWFVDILGVRPEVIAQRINYHLKPGGTWINFGSLSFRQGTIDNHISCEEFYDSVSSSGFSIEGKTSVSIPYMKSPSSDHGRTEVVHTAKFKKIESCPKPAAVSNTPSWIENANAPIPLTQNIQKFQMTHQFYAQLSAAIDGKKSLNELATLLSQSQSMSFEDAYHSLSKFLLTLQFES